MSARKRLRRGAIVGFGFIAENGHLPAYHENQTSRTDSEFEVVAVADICHSRRAAAARAIPGARIYESHVSLLREEGHTLDFIDITTPPHAHSRIACDAMKHGVHVMCEKPLATTVEDARAMIEEAARSKRVLFPVENYKHAPVIVAVRQVLETGMIGVVHDVTLQTFRNTHARGVKEWNEHWRREKRYAGGGVAMDHGSHTFYLAFEWLKSYPTSVTAKMTTRGPFDTEDTFVGSATFPTGLAAVHLTWNAGVRKVIYTIHGDKGAIRVEDDDIEVAVMGNAHEALLDGSTTWELKTKKVASEWMDAGHAAWFRSMFAQFGTAIDHNDFVGRPALDALRCIALIAAAYDSARDGCRERQVPDVA